MATTRKPRFLVKARPGRTLPEAEGFRFHRMSFRVEPLFADGAGEDGFALTGGERWYVVEAAEELDVEVRPWDLAHRAVEDRLGFSSEDRPSVLEPDLEHEWAYENPTALLGEDEAFQAADACVMNEQDPRGGATPAGREGFGWHLLEDYSQLAAARQAVEERLPRVRIAHVDTGYDPNHVGLPAHLNLDLARNFVPGEDPADARDPARRGRLRNPGHGMGTLGLLAGGVLDGVPGSGRFTGKPLGGAPAAEVVPLRVASSVVQFYTSSVARAFAFAVERGCDVISMSLGGVPSAAWTEAVNRAYEAGVVMVCAAGNNFGGLPTRFLVYPARYRRVIAACGVMANQAPYNDLPLRVMQGNWGPAGAMETAMAAYTPNVPWAELGCPKIVDMDGAGTSSATPQIAAAAALWLAKHRPRHTGWRRVEAVRKALFESAHHIDDRLGRGALRAQDALDIRPARVSQLRRAPVDRAGFPLIRLLTGLGLTPSPSAPLFELEAAQLLQQSKTLEDIVVEAGVDPDVDPRAASQAIRPRLRQQLAEALLAEPSCSNALRQHLGDHFVSAGRRVAVPAGVPTAAGTASSGPASQRIPAPAVRSLRAYAFDPSLGLSLDTAVLNKVTVEVPWETLGPGPVGEYLEVVDVDPPSGCAYAPVDLEDPRLLAQHGLEPSEGSPQFHQQMVYAVAMKTIKHFERALGRVALWSPRIVVRPDSSGRQRFHRSHFVRRLRIYPHALREANAYYSPQRKALLFGYFPASRLHPGRSLPGGMVFTCLSHDVVAHEVTHALLDGLHPRFAEPSNPDVRAFHEAFADIVALFQHFTFPEALRHQIAKTRGDLGKQNLLGELAQQFGEAIGHYGALRSAIGEIDPETQQWRPQEPDPDAYLRETRPHARGAILVASVFDAFLAIYKRRIKDLLRIATGGSGVLPDGDIHPDLVERLAREASTSAEHVLNIAIRALDYCPPVDITFGEYLRALITADSDLVPNDDLNYRVAFIEAFRRRGIYPDGVRTLSTDTLRWRSPAEQDALSGLLEKLRRKVDLSWDLGIDRRQAFQRSKSNAAQVWQWATETLDGNPEAVRALGLVWGEDAPPGISRSRKGRVATEIHSVRPARRLAPDGSFVTELVVEITQRRREPRDPYDGRSGTLQFRGGCTLLIDLKSLEVRYCIKKDILDEDRLRRQRRFEVAPGEASLHGTYFGDRDQGRREPFALLHRGH